MYVFLVLCIPLFALVALFRGNHRFSTGNYVTVFVLGALTAVLYCMVASLFVRSYRLPRYDFLSEWGYCLLVNVAVPYVLCAVLFFVFGQKPFGKKLARYALFVLAFFSVELPYQTIHMNNAFDFFLLFVKPLLVVAQVSLVNYCCNLFLIRETVPVAIACLLLPVALLAPSLLEALYAMGVLVWLRVVLCALFMGISVFASVVFFSKLNMFGFERTQPEDEAKPVESTPPAAGPVVEG